LLVDTGFRSLMDRMCLSGLLAAAFHDPV